MFSTRSRGGQLGRNHGPGHQHAGKGYATKSTKAETCTKKHISQTGARCFAHPIPELCSTATVTHASDLEGYTDSYPFLPIPLQHAGFGVLVHGTLFQGYLECIQSHRAATKATMDNGTTFNNTPSQHWVNSRVPLRPQTLCTLCPHDLPWNIK